MVTQTVLSSPLTIHREGRVAVLRKARTPYRCSHCQEYILKGSHYYEVIIGGGAGLGGRLHPERVHTGCLDAFFAYLKHRREEVEQILENMEGVKL